MEVLGLLFSQLAFDETHSELCEFHFGLSSLGSRPILAAIGREWEME